MYAYNNNNDLCDMSALDDQQRRRVHALIEQSGAHRRDAVRAVLVADYEAERLARPVRRNVVLLPLQLLGLWR